MDRERTFLRTFAIASAIGVTYIASSAFKQTGNHKFAELDVERINIVEPDGTVKMIITNVNRFPNGTDKINGRKTNADRKKRSGMLFYNEEGIECGGFIYDGAKSANGHSSGLSLTYDQYDGDQVMQLLTQDFKKGDKRMVTSSLVFNDRPEKETQERMMEISDEIAQLRKENPEAAKVKYKQYQEEGLVGGAPRIMLGKTRSMNNGLFLFDDQGMPKAMFYVDKDNNAKLDFYDDKGNVIASFPETTK